MNSANDEIMLAPVPRFAASDCWWLNQATLMVLMVELLQQLIGQAVQSIVHPQCLGESFALTQPKVTDARDSSTTLSQVPVVSRVREATLLAQDNLI